MTDRQRAQKLVQTSNHNDGGPSSCQTNSRNKIYKRSATLLTVLLCSATFAALDASSTKLQTTTPKLSPVDSNQQAPSQGQRTTTSVSSPSVTNSTTNNTSVTSNSSASSTTVTINGKSVTVPANGSYQKTSSSGSDSTSVNVNHSSSTTGSGQNTSSVNIDVNSQSGGG